MIQGPQLIIVLAIILLLFGGSKLPKLARSLGQAQKEFRDGLKDGQEEDDDAPSTSSMKSDAAPSDQAATNQAATNQTGTNQASQADAAPPAGEAPRPASTPGDDDTSRGG